jgi:hypothetical protein
MIHLSVPLHVWLATLLIVAPIPETWIKFAIALVMVIVIAVTGG